MKEVGESERERYRIDLKKGAGDAKRNSDKNKRREEKKHKKKKPR